MRHKLYNVFLVLKNNYRVIHPLQFYLKHKKKSSNISAPSTQLPNYSHISTNPQNTPNKKTPLFSPQKHTKQNFYPKL